MNYEDLIARKSAAPRFGGIEPSELPPHLFPHQRDLVRWALRRGRAAIFADTGLGKAQPYTEPVLTPTGWRAIGELELGDMVVAQDGSETRIVGIFPQGEREIVEVRFSDGATVRCDWEHLWTVQTDLDASRRRPWRTFTTRQLVDRGLSIELDQRSRWRVPIAAPAAMRRRDLPIDPYVLGVLLGDGSFRQATSVCFTTVDQQIADEVGWRLPFPLRVAPIKASRDRVRAQSYRIARPRPTSNAPNPIIEALRAFGLWGRLSHEKWIPHEYLLTSAEQRLELLQGMMDTDGYVARDGTIQYGTSSSALADCAVALVRSLGGLARVSSKEPTYLHRGERRAGKTHYTLTIALPAETVPFRLKRKAERCKRRAHPPARKIVSVREVGRAQCVCIAIAHPSQLYVTSDYVVTHNTAMELEWARQASRHGPGLILTPLAVAQQTEREAQRWGVPAVFRRAPAGDLITITNYDMLHAFDPSAYTWVVLDESSILKNFSGATRRALTEAFAATPFRLCATATPAPNDHTELGTHAAFLGVKSREEMLAEFFVHDGGSTQAWRLKGHAVGPFWKWVATWGAVVKRPSDLGHDDAGFALPELRMHEHIVPIDEADVRASGRLFAADVHTLSEQRAIRRSTIDRRVAKAAELAAGDDLCLVWCELNDEGGALAEAIPGAVQVAGSDDPDTKAERLLAFAEGRVRCLVSKAGIAGMGLNLQRCARMVFVGASHSYEQRYQAIRRCWRFGQTRPVDVHVIRTDADGAIVANMRDKERAADEMAAEMTRHVGEAVRAEVTGSVREWNPYQPTIDQHVPAWIGREDAA